MIKAMGDKGVFGANRFLPDGTSPPPALTGQQERDLKRMKDRQEYEEARMKHLLEQRKKEKEDKTDGGKELPAPKREPDMPTPNRPGALGWRTHARTKTITKTQASE